MPTTNISLTSAWTQIADTIDPEMLVTFDNPSEIEVAVTSANAAPSVTGHRLARDSAITRGVMGPGYVWARLLGNTPASILLVITK